MQVLFSLLLLAGCNAGSTPDPGPGSPTYQRIQWSGMLVEDLEAAISFYRDTVGLQLVESGGSWAWFELADGSQFELKDGGTASKSVKGADKQSAVFAFQVDDLQDAMGILEGRGVSFFDAGSGAGEEWVYFADPEGNILEIKQVSR